MIKSCLTTVAALFSVAAPAQELSAFLGHLHADMKLYTQAALQTEVKPGALVTVVPVELKQPARTVAVRSVEKQNHCEDENDNYWWVTTEQFGEVPADFNTPRDRSYSAGIFFPPQPKAKAIPLTKLAPAALPEGVTTRLIAAAFSLAGAQDPDLLFTWSCALDECNYPSERVFRKISGAWRIIREQHPC